MDMLKQFLKILGLSFLFGQQGNTENQLRWIDNYLAKINRQVQADIKSEKQGFFPHENSRSNKSLGYIDYLLRNKHGERLEIAEHSALTINKVEATENYIKLKKQVEKLAYKVAVKQITIDGDEVSSEEELDEFIFVHYHYIVITVSGW